MREFTPEGLGSSFLYQIRTSSFLRVIKQKVMWNEQKKKAVQFPVLALLILLNWLF